MKKLRDLLHLKPLAIGAAVGLGVFLLLPALASVVSENTIRVSEDGNYIAIYPSIAQAMGLQPAFNWVLGGLLSIVAGVGFAAAKVGLIRFNPALPAFGLVFLSYTLLYSGADSKKEFTHKTFNVQDISRKDALKFKFHSFNQEDSLYNEAFKPKN
jgi:hypothetical protein